MAKHKIDTKSGSIGEFLSTLFWALLIALIVRTFLFQPFHIPSGSMQPNLLKGDYIITSKYSLGYGQYAADPVPFPVKSGRLFERSPERGDIVVFKPVGERKNFIKRLIGLPGDEIQIQDGIVILNGTPLEAQRLTDAQAIDPYNNASVTEVWKETLPNGKSYRVFDEEKNSHSDNSSVFTVPAGHYFMMGDNRDHSADSRMTTREGGAGYIPAENIIGRAEFILLSAKEDFSIIRPWTWYRLRGDRFFVGLR